jgi:hypothetical protein
MFFFLQTQVKTKEKISMVEMVTIINPQVTILAKSFCVSLTIPSLKQCVQAIV